MVKKKIDSDTESITFRCPVEIKRGLEDLAHLSRQDVSALLVELCTSLVAENKRRITSFRQQAGQPIKMPTYTATPQKKKDAAQMSDEGDDSNAED